MSDSPPGNHLPRTKRATTNAGRPFAHPDEPHPPPGNLASVALHLAVGDLVVYASHGIGRVESRQPGGILILVFENGLKVTLPLDRAQNALRSLSGEPELEEVQRTLHADTPPPLDEHWSRRHRRSQATFVGGRISGLAEIVRDGIHRERRGGKGSRTSTGTQLYRQARKLLVAEVAAARGIEPDAADAWIVEQVSGAP